MSPLTPDQLRETLAQVVDRLRAAFDPAAIYLFGSYAEGRAGPGSDLDLLVIVPESAESFYQRCAAGRAAVGSIGMPVDVQVYTRAEFERRAEWPVSFERTVRTRGQVLYAA